MDVLTNRLRAVLVGFGIILLGIVLQQFATLPVFLIDAAAILDPENASRLGVMVLLPLNFIGLAAAGVVYMVITGRGWEWIDLPRPGKWDFVWMIGGTILTIVALIFVGIAAQAAEAQPPEQALMVLISEDVVLLLFMIAVVWLLNAPAEEFLFRNVVQKRLYDAYSGIGAVLITSVLFALIHILTFILVGVRLFDVFFPIFGIFIGSVVMGFAYLRTENLWVPIVIHAAFNSIQLIITLIVLVYDIDPETAANALALLLG